MLFAMLKKGTKGFTIIEVLVVISIIGILVAILVLSFDAARKHSRDSARKASLKQLQLAIETYRAQNGKYPAKGCGDVSTKWIGPNITGNSNTNVCTDYIAGVAPEFIAALPVDAKQGGADSGFLYQTDSSQTAYKVIINNTVETDTVSTYSDEFARCALNCGNAACPATPPANTYAVYSKGAECW